MQDGDFPRGAVVSLKGLGEWLNVNGEGIYETRICAPYIKNDFYFTQNPKTHTVYAFCHYETETSVDTEMIIPYTGSVNAVIFLETGETASYTIETKDRYNKESKSAKNNAAYLLYNIEVSADGWVRSIYSVGSRHFGTKRLFLIYRSGGSYMIHFTFESHDMVNVLETNEWDNTWWEQTEKETTRRILYIGDSISCGIRHYISRISNGEILCDGFGTSKSLDNPYLIPSIELFMKQQSKCDAILFNNGLHGWHLSTAEYGKYYEEMLQYLSLTAKPVYVILTTDDRITPKHNELVIARNEVAKKLAMKYRYPVIDLHTLAINNEQYHTDGIHFNDEGYELFARCIVEHLK